MEVTCTICKHYSRTMEQHERHTQTAAHNTNAEIYENGIAAGEHKSAATIARLRGLLEKIDNVVLRNGAWENSNLRAEVRAELDSEAHREEK